MSLTSCEWEKLCCSGLTASSVEGVRLESFKAADSWIVICLTAQNTSRTFQLFREKKNWPETPLRNVRGSFYCGQGKSSTCRYPTGFQEILSLYLLPIHFFWHTSWSSHRTTARIILVWFFLQRSSPPLSPHIITRGSWRPGRRLGIAWSGSNSKRYNS